MQVTPSSSPLDCNADGSVNAADVACADSASISEILAAANFLAGDLDLDGEVAFNDFLVLSGNFGKQGVGYSGGDIDLDNTVAFSDFLSLSGNFGQTSTGMQAVPEPSPGLQWKIGLLLLSVIRLRQTNRDKPK